MNDDDSQCGFEGGLQKTNCQGDPDAEELTSDTEVAPVDRGRLVFWIVLLNGVGVLLPWNMFITIAPQVSLNSFTDNNPKFTVLCRLLVYRKWNKNQPSQ